MHGHERKGRRGVVLAHHIFSHVLACFTGVVACLGVVVHVFLGRTGGGADSFGLVDEIVGGALRMGDAILSVHLEEVVWAVECVVDAGELVVEQVSAQALAARAGAAAVDAGKRAVEARAAADVGPQRARGSAFSLELHQACLATRAVGRREEAFHAGSHAGDAGGGVQIGICAGGTRVVAESVAEVACETADAVELRGAGGAQA